MSAGLPGLGLGGLFFIFSALLAPLFELVRAVQGRSTAERWRQVARQFLQAVLMIAAVEATLRGLYLVLGAFGSRDGEPVGATALPLAPIMVTGGLLAVVLVAAKLAELVLRGRPVRRRTLSLPVSRWALVGVSAVATGSTVLLAIGAAEYGPLDRSLRSPAIKLDLPQEIGRDAGAMVSAAGRQRPFNAPEPERPGKDGRSEAASPPGDAAPSGLPPASSGDSPRIQGGGREPTAPPPPPPVEGPAQGGPPSPPGPPESAGPPSHSQAPPHAGPPGGAGPPVRSGN
jgi:hypothetical protein